MVEILQNGRDLDFDIQQVPIADIKVGTRVRKDMGDINALARSIKENGLLVPIALQSDRTLIYGARRIAAYKKLKKRTIPCVVLRSHQDKMTLLKAEEQENVQRKAFTPSEKQYIAQQIIMASKTGGKGMAQVPGHTPHWKAAGFGSEREYKAATTVVNKAQESEAAEAVQALMDAEVLSPNGAEKLLQLPIEEVEQIANEIGISTDPQEVREERERVNELYHEHQKKQKEKKQKQRDHDQTKIYVDKWIDIFRVVAGVKEEYGSMATLLQTPPHNQKRNVKHWQRLAETLEDTIPLLRRYHKEVLEHLNG